MRDRELYEEVLIWNYEITKFKQGVQTRQIRIRWLLRIDVQIGVFKKIGFSILHQ